MILRNKSEVAHWPIGSAGIQLAKLSSPWMRRMDPSWHLEVVPDPNYALDGTRALFGRTLAGTGQHCANGAAVWRSAIRWTGRCWSQCDLENSGLPWSTGASFLLLMWSQWSSKRAKSSCMCVFLLLCWSVVHTHLIFTWKSHRCFIQKQMGSCWIDC